MPSRNEKHKSDWQTVVDSNNGNVWYVVFERNIARILIISLKNTTRITVSLECHLYYSPISLNVTKTLTPTLEHRYWGDAMEQILKLAENICVELKEQFNTYFHQLFPYVTLFQFHPSPM